MLNQLVKIVTWSNGGVRYSIRFPSGGFFNSWLVHPAETDSKLLKRFETGDVIWPAKYALQAEINRRISGEDPELMIKPQLVWTSEMDQRIIFTPKSLHAGMWLQFAQAVTGEFQLKRVSHFRQLFAGNAVRSRSGTVNADAFGWSTCSGYSRSARRVCTRHLLSNRCA